MISDKSDTREQILDAAQQRFKHYGYSKTTMSEVAKDCEMSAGNIYRFFASKLDIAEAIAEAYNRLTFIEIEKIAHKNAPAPLRLYEVFTYGLQETYRKMDVESKLLEVADILRKERPKFLNNLMAEERVSIVKILADGVDEGVFRSLDDPGTTAEMIQAATMKFRFPQSYSNLTLPQLERELQGVMTLLLAGLSVQAVEPNL